MPNPFTLSRHGRSLLAGLSLLSLALPGLASAQINAAHEQDYLAALQRVSQAETRIATAMEQVQSGQVAHYDFLQQEHIELLRHARALAWPPGALEQSQKTALTDAAGSLLSAADSLEWVIADFLRALAQVRGAASNTLDIAAQSQQGASSALSATLESLQLQTLLFMASGYREDWSVLSGAFDAVLSADLSAQTKQELLFQKERLALYAPQLQEQQQALLESDVDLRAASLLALYPAAN